MWYRLFSIHRQISETGYSIRSDPIVQIRIKSTNHSAFKTI